MPARPARTARAADPPRPPPPRPPSDRRPTRGFRPIATATARVRWAPTTSAPPCERAHPTARSARSPAGSVAPPRRFGRSTGCAGPVAANGVGCRSEIWSADLLMRIRAQVYGTPSAARTTGTTARRAVSSERKTTPWRPASSIEYSRTLVSWKVPKYGSGSAVPNAVARIVNGISPAYVWPSNTSGRVPGGNRCATSSGRTGQWMNVRSAQNCWKNIGGGSAGAVTG